MSKLLIPENPIMLLPALAKALGLNEAIFLQQLHYWILTAAEFDYGVVHNEKRWVYKTAEEWVNRDFPFWSARTLRRIIKNLTDNDYLLTEQLNADRWVRTNYYTINYEKLNQLNSPLGQSGTMQKSAETEFKNGISINALEELSPLGQSGTMHKDKVAQSIRTKWHNVPETTTETSSETSYKYINTTETSLDEEKNPTKEKSKMTLDWEPQNIEALLKIAGIEREIPKNIHAKFVAYWMSKDAQFNSEGWDHKYFQTIMFEINRENNNTQGQASLFDENNNAMNLGNFIGEKDDDFFTHKVIVDDLFKFFNAIWPRKFASIWKSSVDVETSKEVWAIAFSQCTHLNIETLEKGKTKIKLEEWPPDNPAQFLKFCHLSAEEVAAPITNDAFNEAVQNTYRPTEAQNWTHKCVLAAAQQTPKNLFTDNLEAAKRKFEENYQEALDNHAALPDLKKEKITKRAKAEKKVENKAENENIGLDAIANLKNIISKSGAVKIAK